MAKATIIIPTYNRSKYLQLTLGYYDKYGKDFNIIIADSSSEENKKLNRKIISSLSDLNIQYIEYPEETNPYHKFADIISYAREKYCVFCGDDDFVVPSGINQCVDFLEENPDFIMAHGYYIGFYLNPKKRRNKQFCWETRYSRESITFSDPKDRLFKQLSEYSLPTFYGVHRTDFLNMSYRELLKSRADTVFFGEMLPSMLDLIYGKTKCLDIMYMARRVGPRSDYRPSLMDFINEGKYDAEYAKFRQCLATYLDKKSQLNVEESKKVIDDAMSMYIKKYFSPGIKRSLRNKAEHNKAFNKVYKSARFVYRLITGGNLTSRYNFLPEYYDDFNKIRNYVISHANKK